MRITDYTYAVAIRQSSQLSNNCTIEDFVDVLNQNLPDLCLEGESYSQGKMRGMYRFVEPNELNPIAQLYNWPIKSACPFVGDVFGYCLFQFWDTSMLEYIVEEIRSLGCGFFAQINGGFCFDFVKEKELTLREVACRNGFGEGSLILLETDDFNQYIRNAIEESLVPFGLKPKRFVAGDHEHIISGFEDDYKNRIENWKIFEANVDTVLLKLWVADHSLFDKITL